MSGLVRLSPHFTLEELCKSQTAARKGLNNTAPARLHGALKNVAQKVLEPVRQCFKAPFSPNSGYRGPELNALIGGSARSQHCHGQAVDIEVPGISNYDLATWISDNLTFDQLILECYTAGVPTSGWVHVSLKPGQDKNRNQVLTYTGKVYKPGLVK